MINAQLGAIHTEPPDHVPQFAARANLNAMDPSTDCDYHDKAPVDGDALGNDVAGCCVKAWDYQEERLRLANAMGSTWKPTRELVLADYSRLTGYDPATGQPDNGLDTSFDTADLCSRGLQINEQLLDIPFWATIDPTNLLHLQVAVLHCGAVAITLNLPKAWESLDWSLPPGTGDEWKPGSWSASGTAYHRVGTGKYNNDWFTMRTWGMDLLVHPEAWKRYVVATEVRISRRWLDATGLSPSGLDWDELMNDRQRLAA